MKVDTMRKIDYFVGVPICFVLNIFFSIAKLWQKPVTTEPKRILFVELSEMGSTIIADPAMRKARDHFQAELFFVIFKKNKVSLDLLKTIPEKNIFTIREDNLIDFAKDCLAFLRWTRKQKIDAVFDLELFSRATAILTALTGAKRRIGFHAFHNEGLYRGNMHTHKVSYNPHMHIAKNFVALINALIADNGEVPYSKSLITDEEIKITNQPEVSEADKQVVRDKIKLAYPEYQQEQKIILVNPNASDLLPQRRWPRPHFADLVKLVLAADPNCVVLLTGAPGERDDAEQLNQMVRDPRCVNFAGGVKFHELVPLYSISTLLLTNDSGPGHFSAVTDMPTYVLFGPETPKLYGSLSPHCTPIYAGLACSPCVSAANHRKTACQDNVCLQVLKPKFVFTLLQKHLGVSTTTTDSVQNSQSN